MNGIDKQQQHSILRRIARKVMLDRGLFPFFSEKSLYEIENMVVPPFHFDGSIRDLRSLCWCSIDNPNSQDIDQLTYAERTDLDETKLFVAIADVDEMVKQHSELDKHAHHNTSSVYTVAEVFPMLPEKLSANLTSLNVDCDRKAIVVEMIINDDGSINRSDIYFAIVKNYAKLTYYSVSLFLEEKDLLPIDIEEIDKLETSLLLQDIIALKMNTIKHLNGALNLHIIKTNILFEEFAIKDFVIEPNTRAKEMISDFMICVNSIVSKFLVKNKYPSIRRVITEPKRWDRIIALASDWGTILPDAPNSKALDEFLLKVKSTDPDNFPEVSLSVIKLLGSGEYVVEQMGEEKIEHFGLAVHEYTHSTAPNRRYPDLITQRLLKKAIKGEPASYQFEDIKEIAIHCTKMENIVKKIERQVEKSASAMLIQSRIGESFNGVITGASEKGTWVRVFNPPIEGRLIFGYQKMDVGDKIHVELINVNVEQGFIDFKKEDK